MGTASDRVRGSSSPAAPSAAAGECPCSCAAFRSRTGTSATTAGSTPATPAPVTTDSLWPGFSDRLLEDGKAKARFRESSEAGLGISRLEAAL
jgi:hypothetical protein